MSNYGSTVARAASVTALTVLAVALTACGSSTTTTTTTVATNTSLSAVAPPQDPTTGRRGACSAISNGSAGYDTGLCLSTYQGGSFSEAVAQNGPSTVTETSLNNYVLTVPATWASAAPFTFYNGIDSTTTLSTSGLGAIAGGYGFTRTLPAYSVSLLDISMSSASWGTPRLVNFGLWGYSSASTPSSAGYYYGSFAGPAPGSVAATGATIPASATLAGVGVSWYLYNDSTAVVPTGVAWQMAMSMVSSLSIAGTTVTGTLSSLQSGAVVLTISNLGFTATLDPTTGAFSGTITSGGSGQVKGNIYTSAGVIQVAGQFAGTSSDARIISGAFGAK